MNTIYTASFESPIGHLTVASTLAGLACLVLPRATGRGLVGWCQRHEPDAELRAGYEPNRVAIRQIGEFLDGKRELFDLPLDLRGTPFQLEVYREVATIPHGEWRSYAEVARRLKRPKAFRAVGAANAVNPIPLVIPCHRVVASSGQLQGYAGGLTLKARLLAMENASRPEQGLLL